MAFKVGDRVKYTGTACLNSPESGSGVVKEVKPYGCKVLWNAGFTSTEEYSELTAIDDSSVNPDHYSFPSGVQTIDITRHMDFLTGNAVKYLTRAGRKGDRLTDLKKAQRYIEWAIENEESE